MRGALVVDPEMFLLNEEGWGGGGEIQSSLRRCLRQTTLSPILRYPQSPLAVIRVRH